MSERGKRFVDPTAALTEEYEAALERLRRDSGDPRSLIGRIHVGWQAYRLRIRYLGLLHRVARW
jgi:hypothetical protein